MIHGRWLKGTDDLSVLDRLITDRDRYSWHLIVNDGGKVSRCSLTPFNDSFCLRELTSADSTAMELMLRMTAARLDSLGKTVVYAEANTGISGFGFEPYSKDILRAERLLLPKHCKE